MNKRIRNLLVVIVVIALLGGAFAALTLFVPPSSDTSSSTVPTTEKDNPTTLIDKLQENGQQVTDPILSVTIKTLTDEYTLGMGTDKVLHLTDCDALPVNTDNTTALAQALQTIVTKNTVVEKATDSQIAEFGLTHPVAVVNVTYYDNTTYAFSLGSLPLNGSGYYLLDPATGNIYVMDATFGDTLLASKLTYIGLSLYNAPAVSADDSSGQAVLQQLALSGTLRAKPVILHMRTDSDPVQFENSQYIITDPYHVDADAVTMTKLSQALDLSAVSAVAIHPTEDQLASYGLGTNKVYSVAILTTAVQTDVLDADGNATGQKFYNSTANVIHLGKKDGDGNYYAQVNGLDAVYTISPDSVPWAELQYSDIANAFMFLSQITNVSSITITMNDSAFAGGNGQAMDFQLSHHPDAADLSSQLDVVMNGKNYDSDDFRNLYQVLMKVTRTGDAPADPTGTPLLTVAINPINDTYEPLTVNFYFYDLNVAIARTNSGDTYKVSSTTLKFAMQQIQSYLDGKTVYVN